MSCSECIFVNVYNEYQECAVCGERSMLSRDDKCEIVGTTLRVRGPNKTIQGILYESNIKDSVELKREKLITKLTICRERSKVPLSTTTIIDSANIYIEYSKSEAKICKSSNKSKLLSAIIFIVSAINNESLDEKTIKSMFELDESFYPVVDSIKSFMSVQTNALIRSKITSLVLKIGMDKKWIDPINTMVNTIIKYDLVTRTAQTTIIKTCVFDIDIRTDNVTDFESFLKIANIKNPTLLKCLDGVNSPDVNIHCRKIYEHYAVPVVAALKFSLK